MNKEKDSKLKKNMTTGTATVIGAVAGVAAGAMLFPNETDAAVIEPAFDEHDTPDTLKHPDFHTASHAASHSAEQVNAELPDENMEDPNPSLVLDEPIAQEPFQPEPIDPFNIEANVEVVGYERMEVNGNTMDMATVNIDGNQVHIIDYNLDGYADVIAFDENGNGNFENSEVQSLQGMGVEMEPLELAALYTTEPEPVLPEEDPFMTPETDPLAQNELPDYVNDADVDSFMA